MARPVVRDLITNLPRSLHDGVEGYVDAVNAALPEIERAASVRIDGDRVDEFLMVVAIKRIWATINQQYWTMYDTIEIAHRSHTAVSNPKGGPIRGFRLGRDEISSESEPFKEARMLRKDFDTLLDKLEIKELVTETTNLSDVARELFGDRR